MRFKDLLKKVIKCAPQITGAIETYVFPQWIMGQIIIDEMSEMNLWCIEEGCFCYIKSFSSHEGRHPWIVGLKYLGEDDAYERSINCLKSQGEEVEFISN